ncbi:hypothetical protein [Desulfovibrio sp. DV]|uniref:hypothetical protein n=1 Tax=Desulfovibrio sp. DV TaxID=1844708 RepID=UPI0011153D8B|nr:hypothetical protein [Desulfovibrio sp. DV]
MDPFGGLSLVQQMNLGKKNALNQCVDHGKGKSWNGGSGFRILAGAVSPGVLARGERVVSGGGDKLFFGMLNGIKYNKKYKKQTVTTANFPDDIEP